ncbi:MAG TPA: hypothetical protein VLV85_04200, partial [Stellaceae bacterium]|nr:hypothetical protein [Stellaceae bacterium]
MPEGHNRLPQPVAEARRRAIPEPLVIPPQHFYRTAALPCPYIPGQVERKLITELAGHEAMTFYNALSRAGFRRSHH